VREVFDSVGERLSDGRRFLVGDRFSAADLTFAALSAPMIVPPEYGVPLPQPDELPAAMAGVVRELRSHPAGQFALDMYRRERRA
jgi:glutathione S-transferase